MGLAEHYGRLPDSMIITEKIEVLDGILASGGFADVRCGKYTGRLVAMKTMRVPEHGDFLKVRKVSIDDIFRVAWNAVSILNHPSPAILQGSRSLEHVIPSEHLETCWGSGRHGERTIRHCIRVDGAWEHHGVHKKESHQQAGTCA